MPEPAAQTGGAPFSAEDVPHGNNYSRPEGQNVGNFLTDRPSSRVLAAPGGGSQICFGEDIPEPAKKVSRPHAFIELLRPAIHSIVAGSQTPR